MWQFSKQVEFDASKMTCRFIHEKNGKHGSQNEGDNVVISCVCLFIGQEKGTAEKGYVNVCVDDNHASDNW